MFFIPEVYEWVECPLEGYAGFRVYMRVNLRNFERQAFVKARLDGQGGTIRALEMAAPWLRDWNLFEPDEEGTPVRVPPPAEQGMDAYMRLDPRVAGWLLDAVQTAFLGGKGSGTSPPTSEPRPGPGTAPSAAKPPAKKASSSRRSPTPSSTPVPSPTPA